MADRLILDTGVLIAAERGSAELEKIIGDDDPAIAGVSVMELLLGVDRCTSKRKDIRALHTEGLLAVMPVAPYSLAVGRAHAYFESHSRRQGRPRGAFDLIIAATAVANGSTLVTTDSGAAFGDLPGLRVRMAAG